MFGLIKIINPLHKRIGFSTVNDVYLMFVSKYSTPALGALGKAKKPKQAGVTLEKKVLPVETDTNKLVKFVCGSNILKEGSDIEVKPDSEYPDWLWKLHIGDPKPLSELDPNTLKYWRKVRAAGMQKKNKLRSLRKF